MILPTDSFGDLIDFTASPVEIYMTVPVGAAGVRGLGGRGYLAYSTGAGALGRGSGGTSCGLKVGKQAEEKLYDLLPGMELTPMNPAAMNLKANALKPATQVTKQTQQPGYLICSFIHPPAMERQVI